MTIKELEAILAKKKDDLETTQRQLNKSRCEKQLRTMSEILSDSDELTELVITEKLTADDCRFLASALLKDFSSIYSKYADEIHKHQLRRLKKNQARNAKRKSPDPDYSDIQMNNPGVSTTKLY